MHSQTLHSPESITSSKTNLEQEIREMERAFDALVDATEDFILAKKIPLKQLQRSFNCLQRNLKLSSECFQKLISSIFMARSVEQLFVLLSDYWDSLNPEVLKFIIEKFGSEDNQSSMKTYLDELSKFRTRVKLGDFVHTSYAKREFCDESLYKKLFMTVEEEVWEKKSLQEVENLKRELSRKCHVHEILIQYRVMRSSISLVFRIPRWIQVNLTELEPFFIQNHVMEVYLNNYTWESDGTKEVSTIVGYHYVQVRT